MSLKLSHFVVVGTLMLAPATAQASTVVFSENFSSGSAAAEFSGAGAVVDSGGYNGLGGFADNFLHNNSLGNPASSTDLNLTGLAPHAQMTIEFDLALIDSWDGASSGTGGPDYFNLVLDGLEIFEISVDNALDNRAEIIPGTAIETITLTELFGTIGLFYRDISFAVSITIAHSDPTAALAFFTDGIGWQGGSDESWAIDNIVISTNFDEMSAVPLPAALPLFAFGLASLGLSGWRRKRKAA